MTTSSSFSPVPSLIESPPHRSCCVSIIVPARNEEASLPTTLDTLAAQLDAHNLPLNPNSFEVLLLLNNCTDASAKVARRWKLEHPIFNLHILERTLPADQAHVGTARRLLMDTAWHRLDCCPHPVRAILSTDSDTHVDPHWIVNTLAALAHGADAVGGVIKLKPGEFESLSPGARLAYKRDRLYQRRVAELEHLLDPQPGDPWPRHLEHFGASLACTPLAYARAGGMPPVKPLEDVAFVDALRRSNARLRHDSTVVVYTSARLDGRAEIGLSHQLRLWQRMSDEQTPHRVPSTAALSHRFRTLKQLRRFFRQADAQSDHSDLPTFPAEWRQRLVEVRARTSSIAEFLCELDCDRLIDETCKVRREGVITHVNRTLARSIRALRSTSTHTVQHEPHPST